MAVWKFAVGTLCAIALTACGRDDRVAQPEVEQDVGAQESVITDLSTVRAPEIEGDIVRLFFALDQAELTPAARDALGQIVARASQDGLTIAGHADTTGSRPYNQELSERRAQVVHDYLVASGVPAQKIETEAYGQQRPLSETADQTAEPLNRRVRIELSD